VRPARFLTNAADIGDTDDMGSDDASKAPDENRPSFPPGHQPYDKLVGLRIGALVGGLIGGVGAYLLGGVFAWLILIGAIIGGVIGHRIGRQ